MRQQAVCYHKNSCQRFTNKRWQLFLLEIQPSSSTVAVPTSAARASQSVSGSGRPKR